MVGVAVATPASMVMVGVAVLLQVKVSSAQVDNSSVSLRGSAPARLANSLTGCQPGYKGNGITVFALSTDGLPEHQLGSDFGHKDVANNWCWEMGYKMGEMNGAYWEATEAVRYHRLDGPYAPTKVLVNHIEWQGDGQIVLVTTKEVNCQVELCVDRVFCEGDFVPDEDKTAEAFWKSHYHPPSSKKPQTKKEVEKDKEDKMQMIHNMFPYIEEAVQSACIANANEFAMLMGNMMHESAELSTKAEYETNYEAKNYDWGGPCKGTETPCKGEKCKESCTVQYSGRGYLQTTWHKNYKDAKEEGKCTEDDDGKKVDIVLTPGAVAKSERLAWCTAAYYWRTSVHMDRCETTCSIGMSIAAINPKECSAVKSSEREQPQRRFCYYKHFYEGYVESHLPTWYVDKECISNLDAMCRVHSRKNPLRSP